MDGRLQSGCYGGGSHMCSGYCKFKVLQHFLFWMSGVMRWNVVIMLAPTDSSTDIEQVLGERGYCASVERGAGILRAGSRNYCPSLINIEIPLKIEI
jgi:hypothetical protein